MRALFLTALAFAAPLFGAIAPYYSDPFTSWNSLRWQANGTISAGGNRLTSADTVGGTAMSLVTPPSAYYEIFTTLRLAQSGGRYTILARATSDARYGTVTTGSFYGVDFSNVVMSGASGSADMKIIKRVGGVLTQVALIPVGVTDGMGIRVLVRPASFGFAFDGQGWAAGIPVFGDFKRAAHILWRWGRGVDERDAGPGRGWSIGRQRIRLRGLQQL